MIVLQKLLMPFQHVARVVDCSGEDAPPCDNWKTVGIVENAAQVTERSGVRTRQPAGEQSTTVRHHNLGRPQYTHPPILPVCPTTAQTRRIPSEVYGGRAAFVVGAHALRERDRLDAPHLVGATK